jgi:hypothetical protein
LGQELIHYAAGRVTEPGYVAPLARELTDELMAEEGLSISDYSDEAAHQYLVGHENNLTGTFVNAVLPDGMLGYFVTEKDMAEMRSAGTWDGFAGAVKTLGPARCRVVVESNAVAEALDSPVKAMLEQVIVAPFVNGEFKLAGLREKMGNAPSYVFYAGENVTVNAGETAGPLAKAAHKENIRELLSIAETFEKIFRVIRAVMAMA